MSNLRLSFNLGTEASASPPFGALLGQAAPTWTSPVSGVVLRGRDAVGSMGKLLTELSSRTGQPGAMDSINLLVSAPTALSKIPYLVLVGLRPGIEPADASANDVLGAVLLYEYRMAGIASRVFATDDITGHRTVVAPAELRLQVAEAALRMLAAEGALLSLITLEAGAEDGAEVDRPVRRILAAKPGPPCRIAARSRFQARDLLLQDTLEATLATLGKNTRRNFRRYRSRLEADLGATFVPNVQISRFQFLEMNRASTRPVPDAEASWRHDFLCHSHTRMFAGIRGSDGRWLSLIAGHRHGGVTQIDWQMNRADLPSYSLSTVMRSYLLEHEISLGATRLIFKGGTPHRMRQSFVDAETVDILLARRTVRTWLLRKLARWIFPKSNFLGNALQDTTLIWR